MKRHEILATGSVFWELVRGLTICSVVFCARVAHGQPFDPPPETLRVMTWNVEWMFDHQLEDNRSKLAKEQSAPTEVYWQTKLEGVARAIASKRPDIVALQEIEGRQTLRAIAQTLKSDHNVSYRYAFIQGTDTFTEQDVGLLMRRGLVAYTRNEQSKTMYDSGAYYNLSKHLQAEFRWDGVASPLTLLNVHLRATADAEGPRTRQARLARLWLEDRLAAGQDVMLLGDLNSEHLAGTVSGDIAEIVRTDSRFPMVDLLTSMRGGPQPTHLILPKQFDRILVSRSLLEDGPGRDWSFDKIEILSELVVQGSRDGNEHWDQRLTMDPRQLDLSDHFPVMATFRLR